MNVEIFLKEDYREVTLLGQNVDSYYFVDEAKDETSDICQTA